MGDAARKLTNGFHFLALSQSLFRLTAFRRLSTQ
jgi:hypothetical protein